MVFNFMGFLRHKIVQLLNLKILGSNLQILLHKHASFQNSKLLVGCLERSIQDFCYRIPRQPFKSRLSVVGRRITVYELRPNIDREKRITKGIEEITEKGDFHVV